LITKRFIASTTLSATLMRSNYELRIIVVRLIVNDSND